MIANEIANSDATDDEFFDGDRRIHSDEESIEAPRETPRPRRPRPTFRPIALRTTDAPRRRTTTSKSAEEEEKEAKVWPLPNDDSKPFKLRPEETDEPVQEDSTDREDETKAKDDFHKYELEPVRVNIMSRNEGSGYGSSTGFQSPLQAMLISTSMMTAMLILLMP
jgi:hypothetical protein